MRFNKSQHILIFSLLNLKGLLRVERLVPNQISAFGEVC